MHSGPGCIRPKMHFGKMHSTTECKDSGPGPWSTHRLGPYAITSVLSAAPPPPPGLAPLGPGSLAHGGSQLTSPEPMQSIAECILTECILNPNA